LAHQRAKAQGSLHLTIKPEASEQIRVGRACGKRFARYFSPRQHNQPVSVEALCKLNDVEVYDVERDPLERNNLAPDREKKCRNSRSHARKAERALIEKKRTVRTLAKCCPAAWMAAG
jgi:hypothetical protein